MVGMVPESSHTPIIIPTIARIRMDCMALEIPSTIICSISLQLNPKERDTIAAIITPINIGIWGSTPNFTMPTDITITSPKNEIIA